MSENRFGRYLSSLREKRNMPLPALASLLSVPADTVAAWEEGSALPTEQQLRSLGAVFGITVEDMKGALMQKEESSDSVAAEGAKTEAPFSEEASENMPPKTESSSTFGAPPPPQGGFGGATPPPYGGYRPNSFPHTPPYGGYVPPYGYTPPYGGNAPQGNMPPYGGNAPQGNMPPYGGNAPQGNMPPYGGNAPQGNMPPYGGNAPQGNTPPYGGNAPQGNMPPYGGNAPQGNMPPYGGNVPYGNMPPYGAYPPSPGGSGAPNSTQPQKKKGMTWGKWALVISGVLALLLIVVIVVSVISVVTFDNAKETEAYAVATDWLWKQMVCRDTEDGFPELVGFESYSDGSYREFVFHFEGRNEYVVEVNNESGAFEVDEHDSYYLFFNYFA